METVPDQAIARLRGRCALIVEDDYFIADDLERGFRKAGAVIAGPVPSLDQAIALLEQERVDMAVLDINLSSQMVYPVADALAKRQVPFVFVTGYDASVIPDRFAHVPRCEKPFDMERVIEALAGIVERSERVRERPNVDRLL